MKLKYKGIVLLISMGTMCIGMVTLSISTPTAQSSTSVESGKLQDAASVASAAPSVAPSQTAALPGPTTLEWEANPEITTLVKDYFKANVNGDMEALAGLVSDIGHVDQKKIEFKQTYEEDYRNVECYTAKAPEEGSYVVYVSFDLKIRDVDTLAPGLTSLYVSTGEDGKLRVYMGVLDDKACAFLETMSECDAVKTLVNSVDVKLQEKITSDVKLKEFYDGLLQKITE